MFRKYRRKDYNFRLVFWVLALSALGILLVGSAQSSLMLRQLFGVLLGAACMLFVSFVDYSWILRFSKAIYALSLLLLVAVRLAGDSSKGATRWISIGSGSTGIRFQPVELCKILLIIFFAAHFMAHEHELNKPVFFLRTMLLILIPLFLVFIQPDLKNTLTIAMVFVALYFAAGLSYKVIVPSIIAVLIAGFAVIGIVSSPDQNLLEDYQRKRIMNFLDPDNPDYNDGNLQQNNSVTAIGSGMLTGKGLNNSDFSSANKGNFISEIQNDFIFAVAGEELGFMGSAGIVLLLLLIELECIRMGRRAKDIAGKILCCGVAAVIAIQSFINIGVATRLLPNTGTPLPFVSYGMTSLVSLFIGIGLVLNVGLQSRIRPYANPYSTGRRREDAA